MTEDYMDWLSVHYFSDVNFWKKIPEEKFIALVTFEEIKENEYWKNWVRMLGGKE